MLSNRKTLVTLLVPYRLFSFILFSTPLRGIKNKKNNLRKALIPFCGVLLIISLILCPLSALAATVEQETNIAQSSPEAMTIDLIALRPLGLVATLCGTVVFVVSLPFSALGGNTEEAWNTLVTNPAEYTFHRPLGVSDQ